MQVFAEKRHVDDSLLSTRDVLFLYIRRKGEKFTDWHYSGWANIFGLDAIIQLLESA